MARATTVRFTDEMFARLDQASARTGMPVNSIVIAACLEWMERHTPTAGPADLRRITTPPARWSTIRRAVELAASKRPASAMYPFESFTESAQKFLTRAQDESRKAGFSYIGTEHMLLAALGDPESQATHILAALGVTENEVRPALERLLTKRKGGRASFVVPTSRVKRVIELAFKLCESTPDPRVSTGHILLALAVEGDGIAAHLMKDLGADREAVEVELGRTEPER
jgi:hypothetical protein